MTEQEHNDEAMGYGLIEPQDGPPAGAAEQATGGQKGKKQKSKPKGPCLITARYTGNSPIKVAQGDSSIMLWPNQVYKNLEETEEVAFLIKKRKLRKIK